MIIVVIVQVLRTRNRRWRAEVHDNGRIDLIYRGHLVLRGATVEQVGSRLAQDGVDPDELVSD